MEFERLVKSKPWLYFAALCKLHWRTPIAHDISVTQDPVNPRVLEIRFKV